ncbi:MAG: hypothetical protein ACOZQL_01215 [Myxococcota bacterium]
MPKTSVADVSNVLRALVRREAVKAAGSNRVLSKTEEAKASPLLQAAAKAVRAAGGPNARVTVDELEQQVSQVAARLIGSVNQPTGAGAPYLTRAEASAAMQRDPLFGEPVLQAWEVAAGQGLDTDAIAKQRVATGLDSDTRFKKFATVAEAERYQDPHGRHTVWVVEVASSLLSRTYVSGRDDLWAQKFEVDRITGAVSVLAEH